MDFKAVIKHSWKTTLSGVVMILLSILQIVADPKAAQDMAVLSRLAGGVGLIMAKDHDKVGPTSSL